MEHHLFGLLIENLKIAIALDMVEHRWQLPPRPQNIELAARASVWVFYCFIEVLLIVLLRICITTKNNKQHRSSYNSESFHLLLLVPHR